MRLLSALGILVLVGCSATAEPEPSPRRSGGTAGTSGSAGQAVATGTLGDPCDTMGSMGAGGAFGWPKCGALADALEVAIGPGAALDFVRCAKDPLGAKRCTFVCGPWAHRPTVNDPQSSIPACEWMGGECSEAGAPSLCWPPH